MSQTAPIILVAGWVPTPVNMNNAHCTTYYNTLGFSAYYLHHTHPTGLSKYNKLILSRLTTAYVRFKHIKRTFLGYPFTKCVPHESKYFNYSENACLEIMLMDAICYNCQCYPSYVWTMHMIAEQSDKFGNCRNGFLIYCVVPYAALALFHFYDLSTNQRQLQMKND